MNRHIGAAKVWGAVIASLAFLAVSQPAHATSIDLGHPTLAPFVANNVGNGDRNVVFDALATFSISSAGIMFDPLNGGATSIAVDIFQSNFGSSNTSGALLGTATAPVVDVGMAFYDVPIVFTFLAGQRYDLAFRSVAPANWGFGLNDMQFYNYNNSAPGGPYGVSGLVSVLDGGANTEGGYGNSVMPHERFNTDAQATAVPEPTSLLLLGTGVVAGLYRRRRQKLV
jgi:hypothetical protein